MPDEPFERDDRPVAACRARHRSGALVLRAGSGPRLRRTAGRRSALVPRHGLRLLAILVPGFLIHVASVYFAYQAAKDSAAY